ncbi:MAG: hypothetical protein HOH88_03400 [Flavobacteriales bacterium]|nr:hypothetical protein [Flavobacteriales bacterium]
MNKFLILLFSVVSSFIYSQDISVKVIAEYEDTLRIIAHKVMNGETQEERKIANTTFISEFTEVIQYPNSYNYPFDSLVTISKLSPSDNSFRLFNWILKNDDGTYEYFAYIILKNKQDDLNTIIKLVDNKTNDLSENSVLNKDMWYGALYYKLISSKKKKNDYYTLLAWDGGKPNSVIKIIDVLQIKNDSVFFGKDIFINGKEKKNRVIIQYNANTSASIRYEEKQNRIVLDHLIPLKENQEGFDQFYVPDGSYDSYNYKNGKWIFKEDVDVRSKTNLPKITKNKKGLFKD